MRITGSYIHTEHADRAVYIETCQGAPTGYAEWQENNTIIGMNITGTDKEWLLPTPIRT